ncbi:MAG: PAS domain S-box protein [Ignavibacteriaceae bacterium]|nr:PAS domain S-box protein [Ignavibacteriaceae bacterium]
MTNQSLSSESDPDSFFEFTADLAIVADTQGIIVKVNRVWKDQLGYEPGELEGKPIKELIHQDDVVQTIKWMESYQNSRRDNLFINRMKSKSGEYRSLEWNLVLIKDMYYGSARDITERLKSDLEIRESEKRYRFLTDNLSDIIWAIDPETFKFTYLSPYVQRTFGYTVEEMKSIRFEDFMTPETLANIVETGQRLMAEFREKGKSRPNINVNRLIKKDGTLFWSEDVTSVHLNAEGKIEMIGISRDVTDRIEGEKKLQESESRYRFLAENMDDVVWLLDIETMRFIYVSPAVENQRGYTSEEIMNNGIEFSVSPGSLPLAQTKISELVERFKVTGENTSEKIIIEQTKKGGGTIWAEVSGTIHMDSRGKLTILGVARDITSRVLFESRIRAFEDRLRFIYENSIDVLWQLDAENQKVTFMTPSIEQLTGFTLEEFMAMDFDLYFTEESLKVAKQKLYEHYQKTKQNVRSDPEIILLHQNTKSGGTVAVEMIVYGYHNKDGKIELSGISRNITERYEAQKMIKKQNEELAKLLKERDKFFSIIAHDLRSPFQALLGLSEFFDHAIPEGDFAALVDIGPKFHPIVKMLYALLEELLEWAMLQREDVSFSPEVARIRNISEKVLKIHSVRSSEKEIEIVNKIGDDAVGFADPSVISTIFRNLISNAIKYTPRGGKIKLEAVKAGQYTEISVSDSGIGIPESMVPYILTKAKETKRKGTEGELSAGLGLLITKEYVEHSGGTLRFETEENNGTTFYFTIPRTETDIRGRQ